MASSSADQAASSSPPTGVVVVYVTAPGREVAEAIAQQLVEARLAACVNVLPGVTSIYRWQGKVEAEPEVLMIIKAAAEALPALTDKVRALHPYDEPEVIATPVLAGSASYLAWVRGNSEAPAARAAAARE